MHDESSVSDREIDLGLFGKEVLSNRLDFLERELRRYKQVKSGILTLAFVLIGFFSMLSWTNSHRSPEFRDQHANYDIYPSVTGQARTAPKAVEEGALSPRKPVADLTSTAAVTEIHNNKRQEVLKRWGLERASLQVKVLGVSQTGEWTDIAIEVTNNSKSLLGFWSINVTVYGPEGRFLANGLTNGANLQPGDSIATEVLIQSIQASSVRSWKFRLGVLTVENESGEKMFDAEKFFRLEEAK